MSKREIQIENYELLRKPDGRMMVAFNGIDDHAPWDEAVSIDHKARTLTLHSTSIDLAFTGFDVPPADIPDSLLLAEVGKEGSEPAFFEVVPKNDLRKGAIS